MLSNAPSKLLLLPSELLISILEQLIPDSKPLILPQSHPTTKALLALTRTCRATHIDAIRLLYTYCVHVDTLDRLHQISTSLSYMAGIIPTHISNALLPGVSSTQMMKQKMSPKDFAVLTAHPRTARLSSLPIIKPHICVVSLHIEISKLFLNVAFEDFAQSLHNLITLLTPSLQNLFIDLPLDYVLYDRAPSMNVKKVQTLYYMRCSLARVIENLKSVATLWTAGGDGLFQSRAFALGRIARLEVPVHFNWPKLKCLFVPNHWTLAVADIWGKLPPSVDTVVLLEHKSLKPSKIRRQIWKYHQNRKLDIYVVGPQLSPDGAEDAAPRVSEEPVVFKRVMRIGAADDNSLSGSDWVNSQLSSGSFPKSWTVSLM